MLSHLDVFLILNQGGLLSGWSLMRMVSHQCGLSFGVFFIFFIRVVFDEDGLNRIVFHEGGLSTGGFLPQWSHMREDSDYGFQCVLQAAHNGFSPLSSDRAR